MSITVFNFLANINNSGCRYYSSIELSANHNYPDEYHYWKILETYFQPSLDKGLTTFKFPYSHAININMKKFEEMVVHLGFKFCPIWDEEMNCRMFQIDMEVYA